MFLLCTVQCVKYRVAHGKMTIRVLFVSNCFKLFNLKVNIISNFKCLMSDAISKPPQWR